MPQSIRSFNIPTGIWAFEYCLVQILPPFQAKILFNPIFMLTAESATWNFYSLNKLWNLDLADVFFWAICSRKRTICLKTPPYLMQQYYSAGETWHFRFKLPTRAKQGSNFPPCGHQRRSYAHWLCWKRGDGGEVQVDLRIILHIFRSKVYLAIV